MNGKDEPLSLQIQQLQVTVDQKASEKEEFYRTMSEHASEKVQLQSEINQFTSMKKFLQKDYEQLASEKAKLEERTVENEHGVAKKNKALEAQYKQKRQAIGKLIANSKTIKEQLHTRHLIAWTLRSISA
jgi:chromosome segregation ATPase